MLLCLVNVGLVYAKLKLWLRGLNENLTVCHFDCKVLWILGFKNSVKTCCFISRVTADFDSYIVSFCSIYFLSTDCIFLWQHQQRAMKLNALCKDVNHKRNALSKLNNSCDEVTNIHASTTPLSLPNLLCATKGWGSVPWGSRGRYVLPAATLLSAPKEKPQPATSQEWPVNIWRIPAHSIHNLPQSLLSPRAC